MRAALILLALSLSPAAFADDAECAPTNAPVASDLGAALSAAPSGEAPETEELTHITGEDYAAMTATGAKPAIIKFGADWCIPCRVQEATMKQMAAKTSDAVVFGSVDVDKDPELMKQLGLVSVPATAIYKKGKLIKLITGGAASEETMQGYVDWMVDPENNKKPSNLEKVTYENFMATVVKSDKPAIVQFGATWCAPCIAQQADMEALSETTDGILFGKVDVDKDQKLLDELNKMLPADQQISGVPATLVVNNNQIVSVQSGQVKKEDLQTVINKLLKPADDGSSDADDK